MTKTNRSKDLNKEELQNEKLREFEANNLKALINNTSDLMWSIDRDFKLITSNIPFDIVVKFITGKIIKQGDNILLAGFSDRWNRYKIFYERALNGESFIEIEHVLEPTESWSEISFFPIREKREIVGVACHSRDITHLRQIENNLRQSELKLKEAQAIAQLGNWEVDFETNKILWSEEACRIYGLLPSEKHQTYSSWLAFIHPEDREYITESTKEARETLSSVMLNYRIVLKDGSIKYLYSKSKFKFDKNGKPIGLYGISHDITDRKLAELEREEMMNDIVTRSKNLEQFAYIISHNLRAPVSNILSISNLLKDSALGVEQIKLLGFINKSVEKLDEVIKDLNKILQVKSNISEKKEPVYFFELIDSVKFSLDNIIKKEGVQLIADFNSEDKIVTVKSYLYSIFYNLISNSIKYREPGRIPIIKIRNEIEKKKIRIVFEDNGTGIDLKENGDKVFGLYKRFHSNVEGKGLGLFMVKSQVEELGGKINITSELNVGTQFLIELPI